MPLRHVRQAEHGRGASSLVPVKHPRFRAHLVPAVRRFGRHRLRPGSADLTAKPPGPGRPGIPRATSAGAAAQLTASGTARSGQRVADRPFALAAAPQNCIICTKPQADEVPYSAVPNRRYGYPGRPASHCIVHAVEDERSGGPLFYVCCELRRHHEYGGLGRVGGGGRLKLRKGAGQRRGGMMGKGQKFCLNFMLLEVPPQRYEGRHTLPGGRAV